MRRVLLALFASLWATAIMYGQPYSIATFAGADRVRDGNHATTVPLGYPSAAVADRNGNVFVADASDHRIRKITPAGIISTYAGTGAAGFSGDGGPATQARIYDVRALAVDASGNLYLADRGNYRIRKINPAGIISTVIGTGEPRFGDDFSEGGPAKDSVVTPEALALDSQGTLYFSDISSWFATSGDQSEFVVRLTVRKIDASGTVTTVAGTGPPGITGDGGAAKQARIGAIEGLTFDSAGNLYLCDGLTYRVRKVTPAGVISTIAGTGNMAFGGDGGPATQASLHPWGITADADANLYVVDKANNRIRKIDGKSSIITTFAGTGTAGFSGDGGPALVAELAAPSTIVIDPLGNFLITDSSNARVRKVTTQGVITTVAGTDIGDRGPATSAYLNRPMSMVFDASGAMVFADTYHQRIRRIDSAGTIDTVAGLGYSGFSEGSGNAAKALFRMPIGVAIDSSGNIFVADSNNNRVRKISGRTMTTIAGTGEPGFSGDGGPAASAKLNRPYSVAVDSTGNVFVADWYNNRVRKITPAGIISTYAGNGKEAVAGDGGPAVAAQLSPNDIALDRAGNLYIADDVNHRIRRITPDGTITTIAGTIAGFSGDGGPATEARLRYPTGVAVDGNGNIFVCDYDNYRVRMIDRTGRISTVAGNGRGSTAGDGGPALSAQLDPHRVAIGPRGEIYVSDPVSDRIRVLATRLAAAMAVASGDRQTGVAGQALRDPLVVRVADSAGAPLAGVTVVFTVTTGSATLNPTQAVSDATGLARTSVTLGQAPGEVVVTATVTGLPAVVFRLTATAAGAVPTIASGGVVGAGLSTPPVRALSPGGIVTAFGQNFAPAGTLRQVTTADLDNGRVPTRFAGICVRVGDVFAPIFSVLATQITFQAPVLANASEVPVRVVVGCGTANEQTTNAVTVPVTSAAPEFFYFVQTGTGKNPIAAVNAVTGKYVGRPGLIAGAEFEPAKPGDILTLYFTGGGRTDPAFAPGVFPDGVGSLTGTVNVILGGATLVSGDILYVGVTPFSPGLYQMNIRVPSGVSAGDQTTTITVNGVPSPQTGIVTVTN